MLRCRPVRALMFTHFCSGWCRFSHVFAKRVRCVMQVSFYHFILAAFLLHQHTGSGTGRCSTHLPHATRRWLTSPPSPSTPSLSSVFCRNCDFEHCRANSRCSYRKGMGNRDRSKTLSVHRIRRSFALPHRRLLLRFQRDPRRIADGIDWPGKLLPSWFLLQLSRPHPKIRRISPQHDVDAWRSARNHRYRPIREGFWRPTEILVGVSVTGAILDATNSWSLALFVPSIILMLLGAVVFGLYGRGHEIHFTDNTPFAFEKHIPWKTLPKRE